MKASFEAGIKAHLEVLGRLIAETNGSEPEGKAMAVLSTMVGALTLSRVVNDPDLAQAFLDAAANQFAKSSLLEGMGRRSDRGYGRAPFANQIDDGENDVERNNKQLWRLGDLGRGQTHNPAPIRVGR